MTNFDASTPAQEVQLLTISQTAERCAVGNRAVRNWIKAGLVPVVRVNSGLHGMRISVADLEAFIASKTERRA
jgi:excisionase family DNA binding protein